MFKPVFVFSFVCDEEIYLVYLDDPHGHKSPGPVIVAGSFSGEMIKTLEDWVNQGCPLADLFGKPISRLIFERYEYVPTESVPNYSIAIAPKTSLLTDLINKRANKCTRS